MSWVVYARHDRKRLCFLVDEGNADNFFQQLSQLYEFVQQEWFAAGNQAKQFNTRDLKL